MASEFTSRSTGVVIACSVGLLVSVGPIIASTFGLFMTSFGTSFGVSRTAFSSVILLTTLVGALGTPIAGGWIDRYGPRRVILPGVLLFGLAMASVSLVQGPLWQLYLAYALVGLFAGIQNTVAYSKVLSLWFRARRGTVLAIMSTAGGISYAVMPQITRVMIAGHGWRTAYLVLGGLVILSLVVLVPLLHAPDRTGSAATHGLASTEGDEPRAAMRTAPFWMLGVMLFLAVASFVGTVAHTFPMLLDRHVSPGTAATVLSLFAAGTIVGQLSYGFLLDRVDTPKVAVPYFALGLVGMAMIHRLGDPALLLPGAALMGLGQGSELGLFAYFTGRYFGTRHFGAIYGYIFAGATVASGVGPLLFGISFDKLGGYGAAIAASETAVALVTLGVLLLPRYRYAAMRAAAPSDPLDPAPVAA